MVRDVKEPLEELVEDLEQQKHQDCCVQDVGKRQSQQSVDGARCPSRRQAPAARACMNFDSDALIHVPHGGCLPVGGGSEGFQNFRGALPLQDMLEP